MAFAFEVVKKSDMVDRVNRLKKVAERFSLPKYEGFAYFSPDHVFGSD